MKVLSSSANLTEDLSQPGLMATLLAPDDNAMRSLFDKLGAPGHGFRRPRWHRQSLGQAEEVARLWTPE